MKLILCWLVVVVTRIHYSSCYHWRSRFKGVLPRSMKPWVWREEILKSKVNEAMGEELFLLTMWFHHKLPGSVKPWFCPLCRFSEFLYQGQWSREVHIDDDNFRHWWICRLNDDLAEVEGALLSLVSWFAWQSHCCRKLLCWRHHWWDRCGVHHGLAGDGKLIHKALAVSSMVRMLNGVVGDEVGDDYKKFVVEICCQG